MRKIIFIIFMATAITAFAGSKWKKVTVDDGKATGISHNESGSAYAPDPAKNEYTDDQWASFGITNQPPYIIKDGAVWRNMTPAEIAATDVTTQTKETAETTSDVQMDAILRTIAECSKGGAKTYDEVVAIFKNQVDPKKAKDKVK